MTRSVTILLLGFLGIASAAKDPSLMKDPAAKIPPIAATIDPTAHGVIPWPMRGEIGKGRFVIKPEVRIVAASPELVPLSKILAEQILRIGGRQLPVATGKPQPGDILLHIEPGLVFDKDPYLKLNPELKGFEQRIIANSKGVLIEGTDYKSTALATTTFLQSLDGMGPTLAYPPMQIEDKPGSTYMGLMLDVARRYHPVSALKNMVDMCQLYKVPYFHLHFSDDQLYTLPSKAYPQFSTPGASYTDAEIRDFVAYADARGVTLIPEIELPGHSLALQRAAPELFGAKNETTGNYDVLGVINIANEEIYPILEKIIAENCEIFKSSPYFHMGADETNFGAFYAHPTVQKQIAELEEKKITTRDQLFSHFINRINEIVKRHGKQTICWEGFGADQKVDKDIIIFAWHGQSYSPVTLLENGYRIVNVPWVTLGGPKASYEWNKWYLNLSEMGNSYQFDMDRKIIGGSNVMWEQGPEVTMKYVRVGTPRRQERLYSPFAHRTYDDYNNRLQHTNAVLDRLLYPAEAKIDGLINQEENLFLDPLKVTLSSPIPGAKLRYSLDGTDPGATAFGKDYTSPFEIGADQSAEVATPEYAGPRTTLRVKAIGADGQSVGDARSYELRHQAPQFEYVIRDLPEKIPAGPVNINGLPTYSSGVLARLESTLDMRVAGNPRVLQIRGTMNARAAGVYKGEFTFKGASRNARMRINGGEWIECTPAKTPMEFKIEKPGLHRIEIQQVAEDGEIGVAWTCQAYPADPAPDARQFKDAHFSQWFVPLPEKLYKNKRSQQPDP